MKKAINNLAIFGGSPLFKKIRSTSNLVQPDSKKFFQYARDIYNNQKITDNGALSQELEKRLAKLHQTKQCVTFCSGFMALMLAMHALSKNGKNEVIMPSLTYRRMADIAAWNRLVPHFCDIDAHTLGMTADTVKPCINDQTSFILGVHPITNLSDIEGLERLAAEYGVSLLFDSVEAAYASHNGRMVGSFGKGEIFSLHASKLLNGFEGGYLTTDDQELAEITRRASNFGFSDRELVAGIGLNAKLNEVHAAMALACLDDLSAQIGRNRMRHQAYRDFLCSATGLEVLPYNQAEKRGYKNVLVRINEAWPLSREQTLQILHAENLLARPYYNPPLHEKRTDYKTRRSGDLPNTAALSKNHMLLPCGDFVSQSDVSLIAELLVFLQKNGDEIKKRLTQKEIK